MATTAPISTNQASSPHRVYAEPHRWALSLWARTFRRLGRRVFLTRHVRRFCRPLSIEGLENFDRLRTPALIVANHTSHFDTAIALGVLPGGLYNRRPSLLPPTVSTRRG